MVVFFRFRQNTPQEFASVLTLLPEFQRGRLNSRLAEVLLAFARLSRNGLRLVKDLQFLAQNVSVSGFAKIALDGGHISEAVLQTLVNLLIVYFDEVLVLLRMLLSCALQFLGRALLGLPV